jgi:type III restriction enzyme
MSDVKLKFDPHQQFQEDAINSAIGLFTGQPSDVSQLTTTFHERQRDSGQLNLQLETGAVGNNLVLDDEAILQNLRSIQDESGLEVSDRLVDGLQFDVEMETGTGKTYVYLRTILELSKQYRFTKFIILVPSVAIREGVATSIRLMTSHFRTELGYDPFDVTIYAGKNAEAVQPFATATNTQIMIMTIDSIRGNRNRNLIIGQARNQLGGFKPIDYLNATAPIVIMDEPQNMESELSRSALADLNPTAVFRYSATHRRHRNLIYQLDPIRAHDLNLVKQIVVAGAEERGADAKPYIKLVDVQGSPFKAKLELVTRNKNGELGRRVVSVTPGGGRTSDLAAVTNNEAYEGWYLQSVSIDPQQVELQPYGYLDLGETIGDNAETINRELIRETIREHLRRRYQLSSQGIKVLSLFFVDRVASFLGHGHSNADADGPFVQWFDQLYREERDKSPKWREAFPEDPTDLRRAYFSEIRKGVYGDTSGATAKDDDSYELIMQDKERLLSMDEPVQFIFSHSALREGWDNPNVFQICVLREMGPDTERRQTIGRGLRLPVNADGDRINDTGVAQLTVIANESYRQFAENLQNEYKKAGVDIGFLRRTDFAKLPWRTENGEPGKLGSTRSGEIWDHLLSHGFIDDKGQVTANFTPQNLGFTLALPDPYSVLEDATIQIIENAKLDKIVKKKRDRQALTLNKQVLASPEFEEFWQRISRRTTYRVSVDRDDIIQQSIDRIGHEPPIRPIQIEVTRAGIRLVRGGTRTDVKGTRDADIEGGFDLPDIISELQEATSLTRRTIVDILVGTHRLGEFIHNPNDFISMVKRCIKSTLSKTIIKGIQYEQIAGSVYELRELQQDGLKENDRFIDTLYEVKNQQKTNFDYIPYDSDVERQFAELLDSREDIKLFMKLPPKFLIPTPVGDYNPDWAILKQEDGQQKIYMIRETKSTPVDELLRPTEVAKIDCGKKHFAAIGIGDYAKASPEDWRI